MKKILLCVLIAVFALTGCGEALDQGIRDSDEGYKIMLGMSRSEVDKQVPDYKTVKTKYSTVYDYDGVWINYDEDDLVDFIYLTGSASDSWEAKGGIKLGSTRDDVLEAYGEPLFDLNGELGFVDGDFSIHIYLNSKDKVNELMIPMPLIRNLER